MFGNLKRVKVLLPNDEDVNRLKGEIESLNVGATVNIELLTEVAKQFNSYAQGKISLEDAINTVVDNLDLYLSEQYGRVKRKQIKTNKKSKNREN